MTTANRPTRTTYLSLQDAGDLLGLSAKTIRRRISAGELRGYKTGKNRRAAMRVAEDEVLNLIRTIPTV